SRTDSMRKIVWMMSVSVDGYMEGPNREIDWHMVDDELHRHMNGGLAGAGAFLEGGAPYGRREACWPPPDKDAGARAARSPPRRRSAPRRGAPPPRPDRRVPALRPPHRDRTWQADATAVGRG